MKRHKDLNQQMAPTDNERAFRSVTKFLSTTIALIVVVCGLGIWILSLLGVDEKLDFLEGAFVNIATSAIGFLAAFFILSEVNELKQRKVIRDGLQSDFTDIKTSLQRLRSEQATEFRSTRRMLDKFELSGAGSTVLGALDYDSLFENASNVGLVVHSWERWIVDRRDLLEGLRDRGGRFTLVVHNPDNAELGIVSSNRWKTRKMDQKTLGENTINLAQSIFSAEQLRVVKSDEILWYCLMRFEYSDGRNVRYVYSPFSHFDSPTSAMPAVILSEDDASIAANFFQREWVQLTSTEL